MREPVYDIPGDCARRPASAKTYRYKTAKMIVGIVVTHASCRNVRAKNMTKSARDTVENPGNNVKQKAGYKLNSTDWLGMNCQKC